MPRAGTFEDYLTSYAAERRRPVQTLSAKDKEDARKRWQQADDRPIAPIVIQTGAGPQLVDRSAGTSRSITDASGTVVPQAPTADMRNKAAGRGLVAKSITAIQGLSEKIITKVGPAQRAAAITRGAETVFGNDPEFRTYQDARMALAGNLAVAQQGSRPSDADIKAIWLPLVPDPYRDTAESARMKWDLIRTMSNAPAEPPAGPGEESPATEVTGLRMRTPDGRLITVPAAQVPEARRRGAVEVR